MIPEEQERHCEVCGAYDFCEQIGPCYGYTGEEWLCQECRHNAYMEE